MASKNKIPKSINLLDPVSAPDDVFSNIYDWIYKVGRYVLVLIEIVVLAVFFSRFYFDKVNNDLTDEINSQVYILAQPSYREDERKIRELHTLLSDAKTVGTEQAQYSQVIANVKDSIPSNIVLNNYTFSNGVFSLSFEAQSFDAINDYEFIIRQNSNFENVSLSLVKTASQGQIDFNITFQLAGLNDGDI